MSILFCQEIGDGRGTQEDETGVRQYDRVYLVESSVTNESPVVVKAAPGIHRYSSHPNDVYSLARNITAVQKADERRFWTVSIHYSSEPFSVQEALAAGPTDPSTLTNPTSSTTPSESSSNAVTAVNSKPWYLTYGTAHYTEFRQKDIADKAAVNTLGQPFENGLEVQVLHSVFTLHAYKDSFDWQKKQEYEGAINDAAVTIDGKSCPAYSLLITEYGVDTKFENSLVSFEYQIKIEYNSKLWKPYQVLNVGTKEKKTFVTLTDLGIPLIEVKTVAVKDEFGDPIQNPVPIDAAGFRIIDPAGPFHFIDFSIYPIKNFSNML